MEEKLREDRVHGTPLFPFVLYEITNESEPLFVSYHWHQEVEILHVLEGEMHLTIAGQRLEGVPGSVFIVNQGELHGMQDAECPVRYHAFVFPLSLLSFEQFDYPQSLFLNPLCKKELLFPICVPMESPCREGICAALDAAARARTEKRPGGELLIKAALLGVTGLLAGEGLLCGPAQINGERPSYKSENLKAILSYLNAHCNKRVRLEEAAKEFGLSPKYFCRFFKDNFGKTFVEYQNYLRVERAADLLLTTDQPIMEVAFTVGFENFSYFIKRFRTVFGCTPSEYRDSADNLLMLRHNMNHGTQYGQ